MSEQDKKFYGDANCEHEWIASRLKKCKSCKHEKYLLTCRKCGVKFISRRADGGIPGVD